MQLKSWQRWGYYSQWIIAAGAAAQCFETQVRLGLCRISPWLYVLVFFCTLLHYMLHFRFFAAKASVNAKQHFFFRYKKILWIQFVLGIIGCSISLVYVGSALFLPLFIMGLLAGAYSFFLYQSHISKGLFAYNGIFKILTLTVVWSGVTTLLPVIASRHLWDQPYYYYLFHFAMRWFIMLALCLPFDVRDLNNDSRNGTITIPAIIGVRNTFRICYISILINIFLVLLSVSWHWNTLPVALLNAVANIILLICIRYSKKHPHGDYTWFLLDGNLTLHALIICNTLWL